MNVERRCWEKDDVHRGQPLQWHNGTMHTLLHHTGSILRFSDISQVLDSETTE